MTARSLGLDFGTTNTVLAWAHPHRPAEPLVFHFLTSLLFSFRSALCFRDDGDEHQPHVVTEAATIGLREDIDSWIVKPQAATS
jgi:molecular chaperone DnaK (HSP70)